MLPKRKIKVLKSQLNITDAYGYDEHVIIASNDWEEISEEEFQLLRQYLYHLNRTRKDDFQYIIIEESKESAKDLIHSIRQIIDEDIKALEEKDKKAKALREEKKKKAAQKKIEKARKILEENGVL